MSESIQKLISTPAEELDINTLRHAINTIDNQIVELLEKRIEVVGKVGEYKHFHAEQFNASGNKSFIRSGREATMTRELVKKAKHYKPEAIIGMWRLIIASSLHAENPMSIAVVESMEDNEAYWLAREYFGSFIPIVSVSNLVQVTELVQKEEVSLGVATLYGINATTASWWKLLAKNPEIKVFARIPFYQQLGSDQSVAFAFAKVIPEETEDDITLWVCEGDGIDGMEVEENAKQEGFDIQWLMDGHGYALFQVKGYWLDNSNKKIIKLSNQCDSISNIIPIGAYGAPIVTNKES